LRLHNDGDMNRKSLALLLLLAAGCSSVHWEKSGATRESVDADLRACTTAAQAVPTLPALRTSPTGTEVLPHPTDRDADRQLQEGERVQNCMRARGYTLRAG
jgi:acetyl-CoA carboxylase carboxyltransferase component